MKKSMKSSSVELESFLSESLAQERHFKHNSGVGVGENYPSLFLKILMFIKTHALHMIRTCESILCELNRVMRYC